MKRYRRIGRVLDVSTEMDGWSEREADRLCAMKNQSFGGRTKINKSKRGVLEAGQGGDDGASSSDTDPTPAYASHPLQISTASPLRPHRRVQAGVQLIVYGVDLAKSLVAQTSTGGGHKLQPLRWAEVRFGV